MTQPAQQNPSCTQNPTKLLPAGKRAAYDAAKRDFFDLDREKPELIKLAKRHGVDIVALMQQSTRENWDSLRAAALAQRVGDNAVAGRKIHALTGAATPDYPPAADPPQAGNSLPLNYSSRTRGSTRA